MNDAEPTRGDHPSRAPIVLLGRGGSGTRILSELAQSLGVFLGNDINVSGDSVEWVDTVYDLACAELSGPAGGDDDDGPARLRNCAHRVLSTDAYDGGPWGWKLPETILVLPCVLRAFPQAKIVHMVRHPVTSAMRRTHMTSRMDNRIGAAVLPAAYRSIGRRVELIQTDDIWFHNAVTWLFQMRRVSEALAASEASTLQIAYETICEDLTSARLTIAEFLSIDPAPIRRSLPHIDRGRTIELDRHDPRGDEIWDLCGATAIELGYSRYGLRS